MASIGSLMSGVARRTMAFAGFGGSPYDAGSHNMPETAAWHKRPVHAESAWNGGNDDIVGRADDSARNNSWISGFLNRDAERVIGSGLRPYPTPLYSAFGKDYAWGAKWGAGVLTQYRQWSEDPLNRCDANMRHSIGEIEVLAYKSLLRTGEVLFEIRQDERGGYNPINIALIDPIRIANPQTNILNDGKIRNGIEYANGAPIAAWIRPFHPNDSRMDKGLNEPVRVSFKTETGLPKLVLISSTEFIEQVRGVAPFAASLTTSKQLDSLEKDVSNRAKLETQMGVFIKSPGSPEDVMDLVAPSGGVGAGGSDGGKFKEFLNWRGKNPLKAIGGLFTRQMYPDEDIVFTPSQTPGSSYPVLRRSKLAKMAADMGASLPELSQDHEGINLSNARSIENNRYRTVSQRRDFWVAQFRMPIHLRWMEWEVSQGNIKIPGGAANFYKRMAAITNTTWFGPDRGIIDAQKEANYRNLERAGFRQSSIRFMLESGYYPQETWDQIAYEIAEHEARGFPKPDYNTKGINAEEASDGGDGGSGNNPADGDNDGIPNESQQKKKSKPKGNNGQ